MDLKVGDIVMLKSGSPKMTLGLVQSDGFVKCIWFSGNSIGEYMFLLDQLELVP